MRDVTKVHKTEYAIRYLTSGKLTIANITVPNPDVKMFAQRP